MYNVVMKTTMEIKMSSDVQLTPLTDLFIDNEDCRNIRDFISHFTIDATPELLKSLDLFEAAFKNGEEKSKMIDLQNDLRNRLCEFIATANHPLFNDPLMDEVMENAKQISFLANFDRQVDELVRSKK